MKKNTVKLFILALALGSTLMVSAQEKKYAKKRFEINSERLQALSQEFAQRSAADREKAYELAKINNWPLKMKKDGAYMQLVSVDEQGKPVYVSTHNEDSAITSRVDKLHPNGSSGLELTGLFSNEVDRVPIGVWDGEFPETAHPEFVGRFQTYGDISGDIEDHPTHVLGTILASGVDAQAKGMAFEAWGVVANYSNDVSEMASAAALGLIVVSNHSYGIPSSQKGVYIENYAARVDKVAFENPYYQPMFSAGNQNTLAGTYGLIGDYAIAKNAITVGATYKLDWVNTTTPTISDFSSWGPASDRRIKPDISTDGVNVYSTLPGNTYGLMSGTSMSCPGVTGSLALIQQYYAELHTDPDDIGFEPYSYMLSSTLRALTAHCATEAGTVGPDPVFGWGILDAAKMADVITNENVTTLLLENVLTVGEDFEIEVQALGNEPLVATLAWTDPAPVMNANTSINSAIVNNLDISIVKGSTTSLPWKLTSSNTAAAIKGVNNVDTTEKVEIENPSGTYTIHVTHQGSTLKNPANPAQPQQVYSLVVSGVNVTLDSKDFSKGSFSVWPNPAKGQLNISMDVALEGTAKATIYDMQGRAVVQSAISAAETQLDIENLSSGVYFVNVANGNKNEVKKFIVK